MHRAKVLIIGAGLILSASVAFADGDDAGGAGAGSGSGSAMAPVAAVNTGVGADAVSLSVTDRGLVLPKGLIELNAALSIESISIPAIPPATASSSFTAEILQVALGYGVSDKLTVGASYGLDLHDDSGTFPGSGKGPLTLFGSYSLMHSEKLDVAIGADLLIDLGDTTTETIHAGAAIRYKLAPKISLFTGNMPIAPSPAGQHLGIGLNSNAPITLAIPVGVGLQASPQLYAYLATEIASFSISNSANEFIFSDFIPVNIGVLYGVSHKLDVGASFQDDLKNAGDAYAITAMLNYRM